MQFGKLKLMVSKLFSISVYRYNYWNVSLIQLISFSSSKALYGVLFANDEEAAFSNYRLWESTGFIIAFILQTQVCINVKLYVLLAVIIAGMLGYFIIEFNERKKKKDRYTTAAAAQRLWGFYKYTEMTKG